MPGGESGENKPAQIGVPLADLHPCTALVDLRDLVNIVEIQSRINALGVQIARHCHKVHVSGALTVSSERSLHALGTGHQRQFRAGGTAPSVIVRVHTQDHAVSSG